MSDACTVHTFKLKSTSTPLWISLAVILLYNQSFASGVTRESWPTVQEMTLSKRPSELLYGHFGHGPSCYVKGKRISYGQVFVTSKCLKSRCLMGTLRMFSEGCEDSKGMCHGVNSQWEEDCITYTCSKKASGGYLYYRPIAIDALCRDLYGGCHKPGHFFQLQLDSFIHPNCQCSVSKDRIYYKCSNRW